MMRARRLTRVGLATLTAAALAAGPAEAHLVRPASSFTPKGVEFLVGVAVDQATGDVYVVGEASSNVERFSATGVRETSFVSPALSVPLGVAVDNSGDASKGDVYVSEIGSGAERVVKLDSSGKIVAGFTPIAASSIPPGDPGSAEFSPQGVAVDPANGDVVVADFDNGEIDIFNSSGAFISQFKGGKYAVAVGSGSEIFTTSNERAQEWSPADKYSTPTPVDPQGLAAIAVDRSTGDVFSDDSSYIAEYAEALGAPLLQFGSGLLEISNGVAVDEATDTVYALEPEKGLVYVFGAPVLLATVSTGAPATGVTATTASVSGSVNPEGVTVTGCRFEYGPSTSYGASSACSQSPPLTGSSAIPVSGSLAGLHPDATYHYRLAAVNANGPSYGEDQTFQTAAAPPSLDSQSASALTQTSATLNASINPNNQDTTYHFQFGPTTAYGTTLPAPDADIGSGYGNVVVGQQLTGLSPGTTYHFRVIATNATSPPGGTVGPDQTFSTPPLQPPVVSTGQASGVAQNTATLTAAIDTQGFETTYELDLGTDTSYGSRIFGDAGPEPGTQTFTVALQGLAPGTTYHYRIAATNTFGTIYGADETFTTGTYPSSTLSVPVAPALVPALLLAPAPSASTAKAASVRLAAHAARHGGARRGSRKRPSGHRRKGHSFFRVGHAHGANRGGGK
jgi:NHL repeat